MRAHVCQMTALPGAGLLAILLGAPACAQPVETVARPGPVRPNVLFMLSDDQQWNAIGASGNDAVRTPSLDALAARGFTFSHAFCMGSWSGAVCVPSRAMLMSGRTLWHVRGNLGETPTLPAVLRDEGYVTFGCGKWHNDRSSFVRGFSRGGHVFFGGMSDHAAVPVFPFDPDGRYPESAKHVGEKFSSVLFADDVIAFLDAHRGGAPFFAYVAFTAPHDPRMAPEPYAGMYDPRAIPLPPNYLPQHPFDNGELRIRDEMLAPFPRTPETVQEHLAAYYAMISHLDAQVGRILEALERNGLADTTIVVFSSDHGLAVGQHGLMGKQNLYDHSVRAPLIIAGPGIPGGARSEALVYLLDLAPTLLSLAGVEAPGSMEGADLLPLIRGEQRAVRDVIYGAYQAKQRMVRTDRWKLIRYTVDDATTWQLFDLEHDPWELTSLVDDPARAEVLGDLRARLVERMQALDDPAAGP